MSNGNKWKPSPERHGNSIFQNANYIRAAQGKNIKNSSVGTLTAAVGSLRREVVHFLLVENPVEKEEEEEEECN